MSDLDKINNTGKSLEMHNVRSIYGYSEQKVSDNVKIQKVSW